MPILRTRQGTYQLVSNQDTETREMSVCARAGAPPAASSRLRTHVGRVILVVQVEWGEAPAECPGKETSATCTKLVSADCPCGQQQSCMLMAQSPDAASSTHSLSCRHSPRTHVCRQECVLQQSTHPCRQPRPLLTALPQECMTLDGDCVIQETFHVFLGACSGNVARTAVHTAVHILGQLPEHWAPQASRVLSQKGSGPW